MHNTYKIHNYTYCILLHIFMSVHPLTNSLFKHSTCSLLFVYKSRHYLSWHKLLVLKQELYGCVICGMMCVGKRLVDVVSVCIVAVTLHEQLCTYYKYATYMYVYVCILLPDVSSRCLRL